MVVVFHYVYLAAENGAPRFVNALARVTGLGWSGVDLFFVLSGFLIGGILLDARGSHNYFRVFYKRRTCRIFPLYFAFLAMVFVLARFSSLQLMFEPRIPWQVCVTFSQNFWMAIHSVESMGILNPTWTLAVEEQFYLVIPALIYFVKPQRLVLILASGIVLAPLIRLTLFLVNPQLKIAIFALLPCRMDALLLGVAAAYYLRQQRVWKILCAHRRALWTVIELLTLVCVVVSVWVSPGDPPTFFARVLEFDCLDLLFVCILLMSLVDEKLVAVLRTRWLRGLGNIAYGVYLLNLLVFWVVLILLGKRSNRGVIAAMVALILTVAIARVSWEWFEKPLVRIGHKEGYERPASLL